jgi:GTPase SAR1 family protein
VLEVLDTAGDDEYAMLREQWIRGGEGFVLVYSITSLKSFNQIEKFYRQVQQFNISNGPIMLVGNKSDKESERKVSSQSGLDLAQRLNCAFMEASARNGLNVENAFYDVVHLLRHTRQQLPSQPDRAETALNSERYHKRDWENNLLGSLLRAFIRKVSPKFTTQGRKQIEPHHIPRT